MTPPIYMLLLISVCHSTPPGRSKSPPLCTVCHCEKVAWNTLVRQGPPNPLCCEEITCLDGCTEPNSAANRRADFDRYWKATATASVSPTTPALFGINRFFYRQPTNHTNRLTLLQENSTPPQRRHASPPETPVKKAASWWSPWTEYLLLLAIPYLIFRK